MRHTEATKRKLSEMRRGERNPFYGKKHTPEFIEKLRARTRAMNALRQYEPAPQLVTTPTGEVAVYLAGMIDADGSIRFRGGRPFVAIYNTCKRLMTWLMRALGYGSISKGNMGREQVVAWCIKAARDVYAVVKSIRPWLIVKAADADAVLAYLRRKYAWAR